jgi:hypothetical protein
VPARLIIDFASGSKIDVMCPPPLCGRRRLMPRLINILGSAVALAG